MKSLALFLILLISVNVMVASASAVSSAREIVNGAFSNAVSALFKSLWSLKPTGIAKVVPSHKPSVKFESGYSVETVFDGSKLGIEPYSVEVTQNGELLVLDSMNSNLYRMSQPLSKHNRPRLVAGSADGYAGHVDGRPREARLNHPKGFTIDGRGNIYVADTANMAIRKISDSGVTTIAGGKRTKGSHSDGPSEEAKFSTDFDVVYIASSCSLLVIDRGNQAIREIQLHFDDCAYQYETEFPLGIIVLLGSVFFGYMLALLQKRVGIMVFDADETATLTKESIYQKPMKSPSRPPLIPTADIEFKSEEVDEGFLGSTRKLLSGAFSTTREILAAIPFFRKKAKGSGFHQQETTQNSWPAQESFVIPDDEIPPVVDARAPTPQKTYAFMSKEPEKVRHIRRELPYFTGWDGGDSQQKQQVRRKQHLQQHRQHSSGPQTYYEQSCETGEVVFGAVQESDGKRKAVEIKAVDYGDPINEQYDLRYRNRFTDYSYHY